MPEEFFLPIIASDAKCTRVVRYLRHCDAVERRELGMSEHLLVFEELVCSHILLTEVLSDCFKCLGFAWVVVEFAGPKGKVCHL